MKIIYHSFTGNCMRFAKKLDENAQRMQDNPELTEDSLLVFPTIGFGVVPPVVKSYLKQNHKYIKYVVSSGNRNWGLNFAVGADIVTEKLGIPSYKIELAGNDEDVKNIKSQLLSL